jgi:hypothetical protein
VTAYAEVGALALIAALMASGNAYVFVEFFPRAGGLPNLGRAVLIAGLLASSFSLWLAVAWAVVQPSVGSWIAIFLGMNSMMVALGVWFIAIFMRAEERFVAPGSTMWPFGLALLVIANELLMGTSFVAGLGGPSTLSSGTAPFVLTAFTASVNSVWFFWAMLGNLVLLVLWLPLPRSDQVPLIALTSVAAIGPWVLWWPVVGSAGVVALAALVALGAHGRLPASWLPPAASTRVARGVTYGAVAFGAAALVAALWPTSPYAAFVWAFGAFTVLFLELVVLGHSALRDARAQTTSTPAPTAARAAVL